MLFTMICGEMPFQGDTEPAIIKDILYKRVEFPEDVKPLLSPEIKDLIKQMLMKKVYNRIIMDEIIEHPWFTGKWKKQSL